MEPFDDLFEGFSPQSLEDWRRQAEKDLRGKALDDLDWQVEEHIRLEPYYTAENAYPDGRPAPMGTAGTWQIGEFVQVYDPSAGATEALAEAIDGGAEALLLVLYRRLEPGQLEQLLAGIDPGKVSIHLTERYPEKEPDALLERLQACFQEQGHDPGPLDLSVDFDPLLDWSDPPYERLLGSLRRCRQSLPAARALQINGLQFHAGSEDCSRELAAIIAKGSTYLHTLGELDLAPHEWLDHAQFNLAVGTSYFLEIAKLRAFRRLWANVLRAYGVDDPPPPFLITHLARDSQVDDVHKNMIRAGSQAMAAVLGGTDRLYVRPADFYQNDDSTAFTRRIARNVQHLLRLESHLGRVADPGAGSYYIEALTDKLCAEAWAQFQQIEAEGGF